MNKGWLLKTLRHTGGPPLIAQDYDQITSTNNYLGLGDDIDSGVTYGAGSRTFSQKNSAMRVRNVPALHNQYDSNGTTLYSDSLGYQQNEGDLRFIYQIYKGLPGDGAQITPPMTHENTTIYRNKFTDKYITGSMMFDRYGTGSLAYRLGNWSRATNNTPQNDPTNKANLFILDAQKYLNNNPTTTELHLTLFQGTYNFSETNDERSISTFEVDKQASTDYLTEASALDISNCNSLEGTEVRELKLKNTPKFKPEQSIIDYNYTTDYNIPNMRYDSQGGVCFYSSNNTLREDSSHVIKQGGIFYKTAGTGDNSYANATTKRTLDYSGSIIIDSASLDSSDTDVVYGQMHYELSFLDKAHTLIANIPKERYLPNGIGEKGYVIIPEQIDRRVKDNIDYYLQKAGLIEKTVKAKAPRRGR